MTSGKKVEEKQKNTDIIGEIYEKYYKDVYRFVLAMSKNPDVAEDVTQETFVKAMKAVNRFEGKCDIRVWLCQIAKNTFFTYVDKGKREIVGEPAEEDICRNGAAGHDFISDMVDREQAIKLHRIVHNLSEPYKEVFNLRVFGELSFKDIAGLFGKTESWARVTYHRARIMIMNEEESL